MCGALVSDVQNYPAGKGDPCHLDLLSDHFPSDFWIPANKPELVGRTVLLSWRICREISSMMWMILIINLIFTLSAGLQSGYESCQIPASSNPSQLSLTWNYPSRAQNLWGVQAQKIAHVSPFYIFIYATESSTCWAPQGLNGDPWNTLTFAFSLLYPVSSAEEKVRDESKKLFFHNSVKIKSIYRLFRKFASRFLS